MSAITLVRRDEDDRREADEQVDEVLESRPLAEEEVHYVPIATHPTTERNETPVEAADDDKNKCDTVQ